MPSEVRITVPLAKVLRIFYEAPDAPRYGFELMQRTKFSSATVYPILARLEKAGWLRSQAEDIDPAVEGRPARKVYVLTGDGKAGRQKVAALADELRPPPVPVGQSLEPLGVRI